MISTNLYLWGLDLSGSLQGAGGVGGLLSQTIITPTTASSYFPLADANGNAVTYLDDAGNVQAHYVYNAFGGTVSQSGDMDDDFGFRFSSKYLDDETGLYYYGYRYYDPSTGRWMNRDPIGERGGYNLYRFVENDGVNKWDKLGLLCLVLPLELDKCQKLIINHIAIITAIKSKFAGTVYNDVFPNYNNMPFQHCVWNCRMMKRKGWEYAWKMSELKEELDNAYADYGVAMKNAGCYENLSCEEQVGICHAARSADQPSDYKDNMWGRHCGKECEDLSCEDCCQKHVPRNAAEGPGTGRDWGPRSDDFPECSDDNTVQECAGPGGPSPFPS